jgi:hypothetical protein
MYHIKPVGLSRQTHPTQRAADGGYAARFLGIFVALGVFRFDGESTLPPTAANASRWAANNDNRKRYFNDHK